MSDEPNAEVVDPTSISVTFPSLTGDVIQRENLIYAIQEMFGNSVELVLVEGSEGIGKTTLLAQFAKAFPDRSVSLFLSGASRYSYDPNMVVSELSDQIGWILEKEKYRENETEEAEELLSERILKLQRKAKYERRLYFFVIDGLHEIPVEDSNTLSRVLSLLPFGLQNLKFLISGSPELLGSRISKMNGVRSFPVVGFSLSETKRYFKGLVVAESDIEKIHKLCRMKPGNMASLKRLNLAGNSIESIVGGTSSNQPDWLKLEWDNALKLGSPIKDILGIIAFYHAKLDIETLADLCDITPTNLRDSLGNCSVVTEHQNEVVFVCDAFRRIALKELASRKKELMARVIDQLHRDPTSKKSLMHLPAILYEAGEHQQLLDYLSQDTISLSVDACESWIPLHKSLELALISAAEVNSDSEVLRLSIKNAALSSLEGSDPWREEIDAYIEIEDYQAISVIVGKAPTKEDRLHLLAILSKSRKEKGLPQDPEVNDQLTSLYTQIDVSSLGKRGFEIASDLLFSFPELAIELVQKCTSQGKNFINPDIALARMSITALLSDVDGKQDAHKEISDKIKDPIIQKYVNTLSMHFGSLSAKAVLSEVKKWEKAEDRIVALRGWLTKNKRNSEAREVIEYALKTVIETTAYTANAGVFREILSPLPYLEGDNEKRDIVAKIDGLFGVLGDIGPTTEIVRLKCILASAEYVFNRTRASNRLEELLFEVDRIEDCSTKMECYAILVAQLNVIDPNGNLAGQFHELASEGLQDSAEAILEKTASHYSAIRPAIRILARTNLPIALDVIHKLNTRKRRDRALLELVNVVSDGDFDELVAGQVFMLINKITSNYVIGIAASQVIQNVVDSKGVALLGSEIFTKLHALSGKIESPEGRCIARAGILLLESRNSGSGTESWRSTVKSEMLEEWDRVACGWAQVRSGFEIVKILAKSHPELAKEILQQTEDLRGEIVLDTNESAVSYIACLRLMIRSFAGLIRQGKFTETDVERMCMLIERLPCKVNRLSGYAELALRFDSEGKPNECATIVAKRIKPVLINDFENDVESRDSAIGAVAVALYCAHPTSALQLIDSLPEDFSDIALRDICDYVAEGKNPFEDYGKNFSRRGRLTYEMFADLLLVLDRMKSDSILCWSIIAIVEGFDPKHVGKKLNRAQIADVTRRLRALADAKLPNVNYIQHEGYRIIVEATILRLGSDSDKWEELVAKARIIPNYADSAFVMMSLAENRSGRNRPKAVELLREVLLMIPEIPFIEDRLHHYEHLATIAAELDKEVCKESLRAAWREAIPYGNRGSSGARRRLIDFAHRLDEQFASSLASELNVDEGREIARKEAGERIEMLRIRENIAAGEDSERKELEKGDKCVEVAEMMLEGLNTGRVTTMAPSKIRRYVEAAAHLKIDEAYLIHAWSIENSVKRFKESGNVGLNIRPLYDVAIMSAELAYRIAQRKRDVTDRGIRRARKSGVPSGLMRPGDRARALESICNWAEKATGKIYISDPYFGLDELELIRGIRDVNQSIPIHIVTSRKYQKDSRIGTPWEDEYQSHWRFQISDVDPGEVRITVLGREPSGEHPIHDRWCLSDVSGLRLGTSINSIGMLKSSEISIIEGDKLETLKCEIEDWLFGAVSNQVGGRVRRTTFEL